MRWEKKGQGLARAMSLQQLCQSPLCQHQGQEWADLSQVRGVLLTRPLSVCCTRAWARTGAGATAGARILWTSQLWLLCSYG